MDNKGKLLGSDNLIYLLKIKNPCFNEKQGCSIIHYRTFLVQPLIVAVRRC